MTRYLILTILALATLLGQTRDVNVNVNHKGAVDNTTATVTKPFRSVAVDQSGACTVAGEVVQNTTNGKLFHCVDATWVGTQATGAVASVNGQTGTVVLTYSSVGASASGHVHDALYAAISHTHLIADITGLQTALDGKSATSHDHSGTYEPVNANIQSHISSTSNPHSVTATQVGLGSVDNTSDATKNSASATLTNKTLTTPVLGFYTVGTLPAPGTVGRLAVVTGGVPAWEFYRDSGTAWELGGGSGSGSVSVQLDGVAVGAEDTINFVTGLGVTLTGTNPTGKVSVEVKADTAVVPTKQSLQSGAALYATTGGTSTAYTAAMTPQLAAYATGQMLALKLHTASGTNPTANIDTLGARKIYKTNGTSGLAQVAANELQATTYLFRYDAALDTGTGGFVVDIGGGGGTTLPSDTGKKGQSLVANGSGTPLWSYPLDPYTSGRIISAWAPTTTEGLHYGGYNWSTGLSGTNFGNGVQNHMDPSAGDPPGAYFATGAAANDQIIWSSGSSNTGAIYPYRVGKNIIFSVRLGKYYDDGNYVLRFGLANGTNCRADAPTTGKCALFRYSTAASDTTWQFLVSNDAAATVSNSAVSVGTTGRWFQIVFDDSVPNVKFYIDGVQVGTTQTTNIPASGTNMQFYLELKTLTASRVYAKIGQIHISQDNW